MIRSAAILCLASQLVDVRHSAALFVAALFSVFATVAKTDVIITFELFPPCGFHSIIRDVVLLIAISDPLLHGDEQRVRFLAQTDERFQQLVSSGPVFLVRCRC